MQCLASRSVLRPCRGPARAALAPAPAQRAPSSRLVRVRSTTEAKAEAKKKKKEEEEEFIDGPEEAPSTAQVQAFLNNICGETDIAQIELKLGTFTMKVRRSVEDAGAPAAAAAAAAAAPASTPASIITAGGDFGAAGSAEESVDESVVYVTSPKVGIFRRGKYAANKRIGKGDLMKDGETVKKGQVVAYVEQLGTFAEVKAPQAGEVAKFLVDEGEAVEYGQVVLELAPFFGGHIIGDSKYA
ncbi:hypothetical protein Rsub_01191 [Raphidocelis subcapitata]|uniref:Lipoyl-binding domain-containing protein n=1 Tax=Raphidocelis subcapitata TaxID=307507 RepID=A0A2V0NLZ5_9CHLO|nr:hypothetical protein Rsub_01191 [Raphidocelis subcapitata]|eukprot:GBF88478.1 hypothetical protein Rsub_01191 [Raphidocelis subcapitata]